LTKGFKYYQAAFLSVLVLGIGTGFAILAFTGIPALLPTGLFYAWIGIRGLWVQFKGKPDSPADESPGSPFRAGIR